jgi:DNA invertase Pin-like site-specific DNA recombinase
MSMRDGCEWHKECDSCPYEECIAGTNPGRKRRNIELRGVVREKIANGASPARVAREFGLSRMTVYRYRKA